MSRYDPSERLSPLEEAQASKGTLDAHWKRSYRIGPRSGNWAACRGQAGFAQCRDCGYFWDETNLNIRPNANGYLAQCFNCWVREHQPEQITFMRRRPDAAGGGRSRR